MSVLSFWLYIKDQTNVELYTKEAHDQNILGTRVNTQSEVEKKVL